jgi:hypothetical protein
MNDADCVALTETFRGYSDEYLRERILSGALTELAVSVAQQELKSRGLEAPPPPPPESAEDDATFEAPAEEFVTVARILNPLTAQILQARLAAEGVRAVLGDANMAQTYNLIAIAIGGAKIRVPRSQVAAANEILAAIRSGQLAAE